ncbi:MAG: hypothetical protein ACI9OJ_005883, partial [Myxococcota bacterium]
MFSIFQIQCDRFIHTISPGTVAVRALIRATA